MVVATGVVLSVKLPKVPMPATAAAVPSTPSEPTTLRAVELLAMRVLLVMSVLPVSESAGHPADKDQCGGRTARPNPANRKEPARTRERKIASRNAGTHGHKCRSSGVSSGGRQVTRAG